MKKLFVFFIASICLNISFAQQSLLQSGPMLGYSEMREVMLWVQTKEAAEVQFVYWPKGKVDQKMKTEVHNFTS